MADELVEERTDTTESAGVVNDEAPGRIDNSSDGKLITPSMISHYLNL